MVVIEGVKFRNPIVISSCPLTESALNIEKCIECDVKWNYFENSG